VLLGKGFVNDFSCFESFPVCLKMLKMLGDIVEVGEGFSSCPSVCLLFASHLKLQVSVWKHQSVLDRF
jgi:hypothetical protein